MASCYKQDHGSAGEGSAGHEDRRGQDSARGGGERTGERLQLRARTCALPARKAVGVRSRSPSGRVTVHIHPRQGAAITDTIFNPLDIIKVPKVTPCCSHTRARRTACLLTSMQLLVALLWTPARMAARANVVHPSSPMLFITWQAGRPWPRACTVNALSCARAGAAAAAECKCVRQRHLLQEHAARAAPRVTGGGRVLALAPGCVRILHLALMLSLSLAIALLLYTHTHTHTHTGVEATWLRAFSSTGLRIGLYNSVKNQIQVHCVCVCERESVCVRVCVCVCQIR